MAEITSPSAHAIFAMALSAVALVLFAKQDRVPLESTSLLVISVLAIGFELYPYHGPGVTVHGVSFFAGFGHEALIAVCALMIAGQGLVRTGALEPVGRVLARGWSRRPTAYLLATLVLGGVLSAFVNNTPIVVLLLPILVSVSVRTGTTASRVLMPMGFATLVGGMGTTIGTSTNLLVVSVAADLGLAQFSMFDFVVPAAIAAGVGIVYLWLLAPRLLPERRSAMDDTSPRLFIAQLSIAEGSDLVGKTLADAIAATDGRMRVSRLQRERGTFVATLPDLTLRAGDRLYVQDTPANLKEFEEILGAALYRGEHLVDDEHPLEAPDQQVAEIVIVQGSPLEGMTVRDMRFLDRYQLAVLALHRAGQVAAHRAQASTSTLADTPLRIGDVLLVQGAMEQIANLKREDHLLVLDATADLPRAEKAPLALAIMLAIIAVAVMGWLPIALSAVAGALLMVVTGCLRWRDATAALSTQVILIVVASLALGSAMVKTGATDYLAQLFLSVAADASPAVIIASLMLLMATLTNIVSNNAAAVIGTPVAGSIAVNLGLPAEPFVLAVLFGANMSYATPMAYKTNLLVMNAGGYTFGDFLRVGVPLTLLLWGTLCLTLPWLYAL